MSRGRKYAVVSLPDGIGGRRDVLLGKYGTKESRARYVKEIAEWEAGDRCLPSREARKGVTINELILLFLPHAEQHYRHADGSATGELHDYKLSLRPLRELYGFTRAADFRPLALKAIRETLIRKPITRRVKIVDPDTGKPTWHEKVIRHSLARGVINQRIGRIKRLFKWAVENEMVPPSVYHGLVAVSGLQRGRSEARETKKVRPVSFALVEDTLPFLLPVVADMVRLLLLTGMRAGPPPSLRRHGRQWPVGKRQLTIEEIITAIGGVGDEQLDKLWNRLLTFSPSFRRFVDGVIESHKRFHSSSRGRIARKVNETMWVLFAKAWLTWPQMVEKFSKPGANPTEKQRVLERLRVMHGRVKTLYGKVYGTKVSIHRYATDNNPFGVVVEIPSGSEIVRHVHTLKWGPDGRSITVVGCTVE